MPESPEVDALAAFLDARLVGHVVRAVDVVEFRVVKTRQRQPATLIGRAVTGVQRIGKHVDILFDDVHLVVSLGRHGWMRWTEPGSGIPASSDAPPVLAAFIFDDGGELATTDAGEWVSLGLAVVAAPDEVAAIAKLGPDPADSAFAQADLDAALGRRRKQVKAVLQEQESLAGIGNAYSDEILHVARLSPVMHAADLAAEERARLYDATTTVVRDAIAARYGVPIDHLKAAKVAAMRVHGRAGEVCPVCADVVRSFRAGSATAEYCPTCQTGGIPLPSS